jgi:hypothetical protein
MLRLLRPNLRVTALQVVNLQAVVHPVVADLQVAALRVVDFQAAVHLVAALQVADLQAVVHPVVHPVVTIPRVSMHLVAVFQAVLQVLESRVVLQVAR